MDRIKTFTPANAVLWLSADRRAINDQFNRALTDLGATEATEAHPDDRFGPHGLGLLRQTPGR